MVLENGQEKQEISQINLTSVVLNYGTQSGLKQKCVSLKLIWKLKQMLFCVNTSWQEIHALNKPPSSKSG